MGIPMPAVAGAQTVGQCPLCYDQGRNTPLSIMPGQRFISCAFGHKIEGDAPMDTLSAMLTERGLLGPQRKSAAAQKAADASRLQDILGAASEPGAFAVRGNDLSELSKLVGEEVDSGSKLISRIKVMLDQRRGRDDWSEAAGVPARKNQDEGYAEYGLDGDVVVAAIARIGKLEARIERLEKLADGTDRHTVVQINGNAPEADRLSLADNQPEEEFVAE